ncbi:Cinnamyl alcohol dehydrogenase [Heracleum sosnowskyi]|uniref:Cinnamyl alcohol dehydrogenase n=1 Tax=Heracleum sosnowskyi TaxID=360622 RepID=A0AAD8MP47_9APIA|nr:Cinnamyl alcohol dehydrogenase [Heracleum sosnowskyi]
MRGNVKLSASGDSGIPEVVSDPQGEFVDTFQNLGVCVVQQCAKIHQQENLPLDAGAPLLCAGITTYSPLKHFGLDKPGMHISIVGLGGLGHVSVKFAKAFGTKVTVISTSLAKKQEAIEHLGAGSFLRGDTRSGLNMASTDNIY